MSFDGHNSNGLPTHFVDGDPSPVFGSAEADGDRTAPCVPLSSTSCFLEDEMEMCSLICFSVVHSSLLTISPCHPIEHSGAVRSPSASADPKTGEGSPSTKSLGSPLQSSLSKGEGKHKEDNLDERSVGSWDRRNDPTVPKGGNVKFICALKSQSGNFTLADFTKTEIKVIKSKAKRDSDNDKFKEWFEELLSTELLRRRRDWDNDHEKIGEEERAFIQQKITGLEESHMKERLVYVLNNSADWTYVELWWMMVVFCNEKIARGQYDTPKAGQGKEKDEKKSIIAWNREFDKFKKKLGDWTEAHNIDPTTVNNEGNMFIQYAKQVTQAYGFMSNTDKERLLYVLDEYIGRTYSEIIWITIASFGVMVGSRGPYNKKKKMKTDDSNSDD